MCTISDNIEKLSNISLENVLQSKSANSIVNTKLIKLVQNIKDYKQNKSYGKKYSRKSFQRQRPEA